MGFRPAVTVREIIEEIDRREYLLPAIQREFVWDSYQIVSLFDSLMFGYPIGSLLFWRVREKHIKDYEFYEFIREFHERKTRHNPKANLDGKVEITSVLDGQQRLTALNIGLKGSYAAKLPHKRWSNDKAYPVKKLYLNLAQMTDDGHYDFRFLEEKNVSNDNYNYWYRVGQILNVRSVNDVRHLIEQVCLDIDPSLSERVGETLSDLHEAINTTDSMNFYLEENDEDLDKVLTIFRRVNRGGTELSYSDLLLSFATAQWKKRDARGEITSFVDEINEIADKFNFDKDFVLKACLVLCDFNVKFSAKNFNPPNMLRIEENWDKLTASIRLAIELVASFGFNRDTLVSKNAVIPIAYYLYVRNNPHNYLEAPEFSDDRMVIRKWLARAIIRKVFGGQPDSVLTKMREIVRSHHDGFPMDEIKKEYKGSPKSIDFTPEDIDNILNFKYGEQYTFAALSLLYPSYNFRITHYHKDHIFPASKFKPKKLAASGITGDATNFYAENRDRLANLQLLGRIKNQEKSNKSFDKWLDVEYKGNESGRRTFLDENLIPDVSLAFNNFIEFFTKREERLKAQYRNILL